MDHNSCWQMHHHSLDSSMMTMTQIEVVKSEKRDTVAILEATYAAHEQSVRYQRSSSSIVVVIN